ncbi:hypothetical protein JZ751_015395 [Albula glossodonta]|uniref:Uncharacterized protein n=1 Tax=Albula glossodonta TaxID=121402 RepID=A0A8T2MWF1_9TELE|nr:hypothetical protein JZ751_015395 [Albula glossodonta]
MKKIFSFAKKKKGFSPNSSDTGSVLSVGYEIKEKDLSKVHKAASSGDLAKLKQLAKKNDLSQLDKENRTPLHIACANGHAEVVHFLVESKAKLNLCDNQNRSPLMKAVQSQQERCVATLLEHDADPNLVDINGNTALHLAALIPSISMAVQLLEHEANINAQNKDGCTPLTLAVTENHAEMAEFLLKEGADVNATDQGERTSLMIAACNGQISMVRLLLRYNADIMIKDEKGWTSDDYAVMNGHHACSHLIIEHGTKGKAQASPSHLVPGRKKRAAMLGSPEQKAEAGLTLGGPATDREVDEDDSLAESLSRASKRGTGDSWPSSDEDDDLDFSPKKPQKPNLKKLMSASHKGRTDVEADVDRSSSECLSEQESAGGAKKTPSLPMAVVPAATSPNPASLPPTCFFKCPQATSTPPSHCRKPSAEGLNPEQPAAGPEQPALMESIENVSHAERRNDDDDDQDVSDNKISESDSNIPGILDFEDDYVVSAIRVESRFSDEEEADGNADVKDREHDRSESRSPPERKTPPPQKVGVILLGKEGEEATSPEGSWGDEKDELDDLPEARSPEDPVKLPQQTGLSLRGKKAEEPLSPDVSWGDEDDKDGKTSHHEDVNVGSLLPLEQQKMLFQQSTDKGFLGRETDVSTAPVGTGEDKKGSDDTDSDNDDNISESGSPMIPKILPRLNVGTKLVGTKTDVPTSPELSWGDEKDVGDEDSDSSNEPLERPPPKVGDPKPPALVGKTADKPEEPTDSWDSDEGSVKMERLQPAADTVEQQDSNVPVSLIMGHYEGPHEDAEGSGKAAKDVEDEAEGKVDVGAKDEENSKDSDSQVQQLQCDFASGTVSFPEGTEADDGLPGSKRERSIRDDEDEPWDSDSETSWRKEDLHPEEKAEDAQNAFTQSGRKSERFHHGHSDQEQKVEELAGKDSDEYAGSEGKSPNCEAHPRRSEVAGGSSGISEGRVGSPPISFQKQSESDSDWGEEFSAHEQIPQTAIDDVELDPPVEEDLPHTLDGGLEVRGTEDKQITNLKAPKPGAFKVGQVQ